jgi:hypothetical protein
MSEIEKLVEDGRSTDGTAAGYEYVCTRDVSIDGEVIGDIDMDTMNSNNLELDVYPGMDDDVSLEWTLERSTATTVSNAPSGHHYNYTSTIKRKRGEGSGLGISGNISLVHQQTNVWY